MQIRLNPIGKKEIFDPIRKKYVSLTPEEGVRQHLIQFFHTQLHYPLSSMSIENGLYRHEKRLRTDMQIFNKKGQKTIII